MSRVKWRVIIRRCFPGVRNRPRRVIFLQTTEAGGYPPIIHASHLLAESGWQVMIVNAPIKGHALAVPPHGRITVRNIRTRSSHVLRYTDYLRYVLATARLAMTFRPDVVYASDPFSAAPALAAQRLTKAALVYHEHDTPDPGTLNPHIAQFRARAARRARLVVFPSESRARIAQAQLGFHDEQLRILWNVPRRKELPVKTVVPDLPLVLYYHGSITRHRLPETVVEALNQSSANCRLRIMGYEAPGDRGYVARLVELGKRAGRNSVEYLGQVSRDRLLAEASQASVGLALVPRSTNDFNLSHMVGASNKAFDYMAAGLPLLVSDLPDWVNTFVEPGYGRSCDPAQVESIGAQIRWFAEHPGERRAMGDRGREKVASDWNYDKAFRSVISELEGFAA
jgi:glycosyltransferase involved in cell wall biosynthesis